MNQQLINITTPPVTLRTTLMALALVAFSGVLSGCVTPQQYEPQAVCNSQKRFDMTNEDMLDNKALAQKTLSKCHYFDNQTPYDRSKPRYKYQFNLQPLNSSQTNAMASFDSTTTLSVGDRLAISILHGDDFAAEVEIDASGNIYLPYLPAIYAKGLSVQQLKSKVKQTLIDEELMYATAIRVSVTPLKWAPIEVTVTGAVFETGQHLINHKSVTEIQDDDRGQAGDQAIDRTIGAALRASGGIRPDADITKIVLIRNHQRMSVDFGGIMNGKPVPQITLVAGDSIHVPSSMKFDDALVRPSQITAPGIRVFISNLTQPASSNSQSAVDTEATRFPYGTRLLSGAIAANCVGGAQTTNASRHLLLVTKNPLSGQMDVVERAMDALIGKAWDPHFNPVLLPGDGLACYDSRVTNLREIARSLTEVVIPSNLLGWL